MKKSYLERHRGMLRAFTRFLKSCYELGASTDEVAMHIEGRLPELRAAGSHRLADGWPTALGQNDTPK